MTKQIKSNWLHARITDEEKEKLEQLVKKAGKKATLSIVIRKLINEA
jgi:hypothetical protein